MATIQLININKNEYFDKDYNFISLWDTIDEKQEFLNNLFQNAEERKVAMANSNTVVITGNVRKSTHARIKSDSYIKYYFVIGVETILENNTEKTKLYLSYDLINNSSIIINDFKNNCSDNNLLLYRTTMDIKPTYHNLLKCSDICHNIVSDIELPKTNLYQLTNFTEKLSSLPTENLGYPVIYVQFKSLTVPKQNNQPSLAYFLNQILAPDYELASDLNNIGGTYLNNEYSNFVTLFSTPQGVVRLETIMDMISKTTELGDIIESIRLDYYDQRIWDNSIFILDEIQIKSKSGGQPFTALKMPKIKEDSRFGYLDYYGLDLKTVDVNYDYNHLIWGHKIPYFFSQRWNTKKNLVPYFDKFVITQSIGVDNNFINLYGYNSVDTKIRQYYDKSNISNMTTFSLAVTPNLTDNQKTENQTLGSAIGGIVTVLGTVLGALLAPETGGLSLAVGAGIGTVVGSTAGTAARGFLSNQFKIREKGIIALGTNDNYKKYQNFKNDYNQNAPFRFNIDIYENYLTDDQEQVIIKDRKKYGNYINDYVNEGNIFNNLKGTKYLEGKFINFLVGENDINLIDKIKDIFNKGVFINFNPNNLIPDNYSFVTDSNIKIIPNNISINAGDTINFKTDGNLKVIPETIVLDNGEKMLFKNTDGNFKITEKEK